MTTLALTELKLFLRDKSGPAFGVGLPLLLLIIFGNLPFYHDHRPTSAGGRCWTRTYRFWWPLSWPCWR